MQFSVSLLHGFKCQRSSVASHHGSLQYCEPGLREDWKGAVGGIKVRHYWGLIDFECKAQCIEERICKNCL